MLPDGQLCALATNGAATPAAMSVRLVSIDPSRRLTPLQRLLRRTLACSQRSGKPAHNVGNRIERHRIYGLGQEMPTSRETGALSRSSLASPLRPSCAACQTKMQLVSVDPHPDYGRGFEVHGFTCETCGHTQTYTLRHRNGTPPAGPSGRDRPRAGTR
jgi:hypothetical protein